MACNCLCCGCVNCTEGQEGKCCCGGSSGTCCQPGEFCCSGVCTPGGCGCCVIDGVVHPEYTTEAACEECLAECWVEIGYEEAGTDQNGTCTENCGCPEGLTDTGTGCSETYPVTDCINCPGICTPNAIGGCGTWTSPCPTAGCCINVIRSTDPADIVHPAGFVDAPLTGEYTISTSTCPPGVAACCSRQSSPYCFAVVEEVDDACPDGWERTSPHGVVSDTLCYFYAESVGGSCEGVITIPSGYTESSGGSFVVWEYGEWQDPCEEPPP